MKRERQRWLKCRVEKGMFSDERTIVVHANGWGEREFIVPAETVRGKGTTGTVKVEILEDRDTHWAVLPTNYRDCIPVDVDEVVAR